MTLVKFHPEKKNSALMPGFNDIFESVIGDTFFSDRRMNTLPATNLWETNDGFHIELAAPGLAKQDFKISVDRNLLTVSSHQNSEQEDTNKAYSRREFSFSSFTRVFTLPESADADRIHASYNDGILQVNLPKKEEAKTAPRQIEIK